jgi:prolyl oligopeptidase
MRWLVAACMAQSCCPTPMPSSPQRSDARPPPTRREAITEVIFGETVADPYRWLERGDDPEVVDWSAAQDGYARGRLAELEQVGAARTQLGAISYYEISGAPVRRGARSFTLRRGADDDQAIVYWRDGEHGEDRPLLDPRRWNHGASTALGLWVPDNTGTKVAYKIRPDNTDETSIRVIDVDTGADTGDVIDGARYSVPAWSADGAGFYYTWLPPVGTVPARERPAHAELRYHRLGADPTQDDLVYPATGDAGTFVIGQVSRDGDWLIVNIQHGWDSSDVYVKDLRTPGARFTTLTAGVAAVFDVSAWRGRFYVRTNVDAPRYRVMAVDPARPDRADWTELVAERDDAVLESARVVGGKLALGYVRAAAAELEIRDLAGRPIGSVGIPPLGTTDGILGEPDGDTGYILYTSFTEPSILYEVTMSTGALAQLGRAALPVDTSQFVTEQVWYPSGDGTRISMFVLHKRGLAKTGRIPTIVTGYGGFGMSSTPTFAATRLTWLDQGGVYAIANLRGGGEYGEQWHRAGSGINKQRAIDDLLAAARYLVDDGWTSADHLGAFGGSNGGLVAAAAMTQAPDQFRAVVCLGPLADMVRYQQFGAGTSWALEYGSVDKPDEFAALYAYSPYHHVTAGTRYPALLVWSSANDDRVDPMHSRKLVAAVQAATTSDRPVLLAIEGHAGHTGTTKLKDKIEQNAAVLGFLAAELK